MTGVVVRSPDCLLEGGALSHCCAEANMASAGQIETSLRRAKAEISHQAKHCLLLGSSSADFQAFKPRLLVLAVDDILEEA